MDGEVKSIYTGITEKERDELEYLIGIENSQRDMIHQMSSGCPCDYGICDECEFINGSKNF